MNLKLPFRAARLEDCPKIAELFSIASDGVSKYVWSTLTDEYPGLSLLEIGAKRYANENGNFSYKNCVIAEQNEEVVGVLVTFPIEPVSEASEPVQPVEPILKTDSEANSEADSETETVDVLAPYNLEAPNTWYICALALFPEYRGRGLGTQFLNIARQQAKEKGFQSLSLLCFEQNAGALRLYQRYGFQEIARTQVVPHPLIHHTGDILLMTAPV